MMRVPLCRVLLAAAWLAAGTSRAAAQSLPHISQNVVVTATITPLSLESLGQSVTVLTKEDLDRLGASSVVDVLRLAPGIDARARGPRGVQTDFSIRGATFGQSLILVDGVRINDSQSAHHNGEIPIAPLGVGRIEIVNGAGSTVHGADALGGTVNVITRRGRHAQAELTVGQYGYAGAQGSASGLLLPPQWTTTGWASRSSGFAFDRDFAMGGAAVRGELTSGWTVDLRRDQRAFGANGFYGPSPSKEWTDRTLASTRWSRIQGTWSTQIRATWRNHGDHFRWDIARPGFAENHHRTNSAELDLNLGRDLGRGRRLNVGGSAGGDWVRSTNLGDHEYRHQGAYGELQLPLTARTSVQLGLRFDEYAAFGQAWSPAASLSSWLKPTLKLRGAVGRAFRIPTFTELYYHDPANLGSPGLRPEHGWSADAGVDWLRGGWTISASPFSRWDRDVIDWIRPTPAEVWRSTNVRDVRTRGLELSALHRGPRVLIRTAYTGQAVDAPAIAALSKYVLEYARHALVVSAALPIGPGLHLAVTADHRRRVDGQRYTLVGFRVSRTIRRATLFVDGSNILDAQYREVPGVSMPGRWVTAGVMIR